MTFQAKLITKLESYSVDESIVELGNDVDQKELDGIVKSFLQQLERCESKDLEGKQFDFLIGGRLLRTNVEEHLKLYSNEIDTTEILNEKLVDIEYIFSLESPKPLEAIQHNDWVSCIDANDQFIITGSYDNSIRIFTAHDRKNIVTIPNAHEKPVTRVKLLHQKKDPQNLFFISCGHDGISILRKLNTKSYKVHFVFEYRGHARSVNCVDAVDDIIVTGSFDKTLRLWSTTDIRVNDKELDAPVKRGKKQKTQAVKSVNLSIMTLTGHQESVTGVRWLKKGGNELGSFASCSMDKSLCVWDVEVGECNRRVHSAKPLLGIDYCADRNVLISSSCDKFVRLWDMRATEDASVKGIYTSHTAWISSVAFGPPSSNHFITGGYDNVVKLWDIRSTKACLYDLIGHHNKVLDVNWSNSAYVLSGSADCTLKIFTVK